MNSNFDKTSPSMWPIEETLRGQIGSAERELTTEVRVLTLKKLLEVVARARAVTLDETFPGDPGLINSLADALDKLDSSPHV